MKIKVGKQDAVFIVRKDGAVDFYGNEKAGMARALVNVLTAAWLSARQKTAAPAEEEQAP